MLYTEVKDEGIHTHHQVDRGRIAVTIDHPVLSVKMTWPSDFSDDEKLSGNITTTTVDVIIFPVSSFMQVVHFDRFNSTVQHDRNNVRCFLYLWSLLIIKTMILSLYFSHS